MRTFGAGALALLAACGGGTPSGAPDGGFAPDPIGPPIALIAQSLAPDAPYWAATLPDGVALAAFEDRVEVIGAATTDRLDAPGGRVIGVGGWPGGVLVGASDGFYVLDEAGLTPSPLTEALADMRPVGLIGVDRLGTRELWIAGQAGLAVWADGRVRRLEPGDLPTTDCRLAFGAPVGGAPAVWAACAGTLYALIGAGEVYQAIPQPAVSAVRAIAVDAAGTLWVVEASGAVHSRGADGAFRAHDFTSSARAVASSLASDDVWFEADEGLWRYDQARFSPVETSGALLAAGPSGQALLTSFAGLVRGHVARVVRLAGLEDGALLEAPTPITIHPLEPERVTSITAAVDGAPLAVEGAWSVTLSPGALEDGAHTLEVIAAYDDGQEASARLTFSLFAGPPPTWAADVRPLFEARCALCHGAQGSARRLDTRALWTDQIDSILDNLRSGRMPLPPVTPLTAAELGRIEGWAAAGFPEGE